MKEIRLFSAMLRELEDIVLIAIVRHRKTKDRCPVSCEGKKEKMILMLCVWSEIVDQNLVIWALVPSFLVAPASITICSEICRMKQTPHLSESKSREGDTGGSP